MIRKTHIFAHRGANRRAAENTRSAFDLALQNDINGIETDVQLSRDEVPLLFHDRYMGKLGMPDSHIDDLDFDVLRTLDFAAHFKPTLPVEGPMRLKDFLDRYRARCQLLLEIKNRDWEELARKESKIRHTLALVGAHAGDAILISSFDLPSLIYAHQCSPNFPLVYNMEPEHSIADAQNVLDQQTFLHGYCLHISRLDQAMRDLLRSHNKVIAVYTCNSEAEIRQALDLEVDIIISDVPELALQFRDHAART